MSVEPLSPSKAKSRKQSSIPDVVVETFNEMLVEELDADGYACLEQDEVVKRLVAKGLKRSDIFNKNWLDVEDMYRAKGWKVEYDKPGYNESYAATFTFSKNRS